MRELVDKIRTLTHEPISIGQNYELFGRNWNLLSEYLRWSNGNALILMHPVFGEEKSDIESLQEAHPRAELFHRVCSQTVQTIQKAQSHMPVIVYASVQDPDQYTRKASGSRRAMSQTLQSLSEYGYSANEPLFMAPTLWKSPTPFEPLEKHVQRLEESGLSYAVLGGMYFHLERNPMFEHTYETIGQYNHSDISDMILRDHRHRTQPPDYPHPLTLVAPETDSYSCLGKFSDYIASDTHIRFRFGRGLTYPDPIPRPGEIQRTKDGFQYIHSIHR